MLESTNFSKMKFFVYVLYNDVTGKYYKGQTSNLEKRVKEHSWSSTKTTSNQSKSWRLVYYEEAETREEVLIREKYFKSSAGRHFLRTKLNYISSTDTRPNVPFGTGGE